MFTITSIEMKENGMKSEFSWEKVGKYNVKYRTPDGETTTDGHRMQGRLTGKGRDEKDHC